VTAARRSGALGGVVGPIAFVGAWSIGGIVAHHYSPVDDAISHLAQIGAPTRALMTSGFVVFGIGVAIYSLALRASLPGWSWATVAVSALATLGVAAAPLGRSHAGDTLHGVFAGTGYLALACTPLLAAAPLRRRGMHLSARASVTIGVVAAVSLAATTATRADGLFQRTGLTVVDVWIVVTAIAMMRGRLDPRRPDAERANMHR
jgi:hypothetical membrane protein